MKLNLAQAHSTKNGKNLYYSLSFLLYDLILFVNYLKLPKKVIELLLTHKTGLKSLSNTNKIVAIINSSGSWKQT